MSTDITCPHCGTQFPVDASNYASIVMQVRDREFAKDVEQREQMMAAAHEDALKLAQERARAEMQQQLAQRDVDMANLQAQLQAAKDQSQAQQDLAVAQAVAQLESQVTQLQAQIQIKDREAAAAQATFREQLQSQERESALAQAGLREQLKDQERVKAEIIKIKDDEIAQYKDMKARLSTKMVGESLEQHCENEFNRLRATAFRNAYFEKDNDTSESGTKGDYVFREHDADGTEILSIMFEMKNENDETATKHKNDDFFKKLDKDRTAKGCEYAILVSLLEPESELYNTGIVDVSYRYPKMYVVRPQFFIPIITLLRNAALNAQEYRSELERVRSRNIDITNFESELLAFKDDFGKSMVHASDRFEDAIAGIDRAIKTLQGIRDNLTKTTKHLNAANNKVDGLTVRRLTKDNPTMQDLFGL